MGLMIASTRPASAFVGLDGLTYDGSVEFSGVSASNELDQNGAKNDRRGEVDSRIRVGINAPLMDNVKARVEFVRDNAKFGQNMAGAQGQPNTIDNETANIDIQNAYVEFNELFGQGHRMVLGRQYVGNPGDLVWHFGPKGLDTLPTTAIDGLLFQCRRMDWLNLDLFLGKFRDDDAVGGTDQNDVSNPGETNLNSFDLTLPTLIPGGKINLGFLYGQSLGASPAAGDQNIDNDILKTYRLGVRGGLAENMFTYRAEYLMNDGHTSNVLVAGSDKNVDYKGNAIDLGVGFNSAETGAGGFGLEANFLMASGDNDVNNSEDKSFHDFSELGINTSDRYYGEILGRSAALGTAITGGTPPGWGLDSGFEGQGKQILHIGGKWVPNFWDKKTWARIDYVAMSTAEDGNTAQSTANKYGNEIDLTLGYKAADNVNVEGGYATLSPDDAITGVGTGLPDDNITKWFGRVKLAWGGEEAK